MPDDRTPRPLASDALPLVIQAAFEHPVPAVRAKVHAWLTAWIDSLEPQFDADRIRDFLQKEKGTEVEPFILSPRDLEIAILATRAGFSARVGHTRFRVVSSETIGLHGGLVLTSNLRSYYIERVAWGKRRVTPWKTSFVAPAALPAAPYGRGVAIKALCHVTSSGWQLDVPAACWGDDVDFSALVRGLQVSILDGTRSRTLSGLDITIHDGHDALQLQTVGPESLMRFRAMAERRVPVVLNSSVKSAVARVIIRLAPLEEEVALPVLLTQTSRSTQQWAGFWSNVNVPVPVHYREAIARAFSVHDRWATPAMINRLL